MNLKESFRYQNFLEYMLRQATDSLCVKDHAFTTVKTHHKNKANPDAQDMEELVETEPFAPNDEVIRFLEWIIAERRNLSEEISKAKRSVVFDIDAAIEANKFRQAANQAIKRLLSYKESKKVDLGKDFKFNGEGVQLPYYYEVETVTKKAFDSDNAKNVMHYIIMESDKVSAEIDAALINTQVNYEPRFDVNDTFEDVMAEFSAE